MATPTTRQQGRQPARRDTRAAIRDAAIARFDRDGIAGTGMEDIAADAGLSRAAVYYHFASKRELLLEVLVDRSEFINRTIREELAFQPATIDAIVTANVRAMELALADPVVRHLTAPENEALTAELAKDERVVEVSRSLWLPLLTAAMQQGEIRDDLDPEEVMAWMVFLKLSITAFGAQFGMRGDRVRATLEHFLAPALASVRPS